MTPAGSAVGPVRTDKPGAATTKVAVHPGDQVLAVRSISTRPGSYAPGRSAPPHPAFGAHIDSAAMALRRWSMTMRNCSASSDRPSCFEIALAWLRIDDRRHATEVWKFACSAVPRAASILTLPERGNSKSTACFYKNTTRDDPRPTRTKNSDAAASWYADFAMRAITAAILGFGFLLATEANATDRIVFGQSNPLAPATQC